MAPVRYFGLPKSDRDEPNSELHHRDLPERVGITWWIRSHVLWIHISLILFYSTIAAYVLLHYAVNDFNCSKHLSIYSPALDSIKVYNDEHFKGTFNRPSKFRGTPSPELDAAWDNITQLDFVPFSKEELFKMGKGDQVELAVKFPKDKGGEYAGLPEVFHLLHCIDFLRRNTHYDYYADKYPAFQDGPTVARTHLDHCLELLRISLMCTSDVSFLTFNWMKGQDAPTPNFNTKHRCRNFDEVWAWTKDNQKTYGSQWRYGGEIELEKYP